MLPDFIRLYCGQALHLQQTTREHFVPVVLEPTEVSAVPAEAVVAKTSVIEPLVFHVVNDVLLLPKELDEKIARMHFSALVSELIVLRVEVFST